MEIALIDKGNNMDGKATKQKADLTITALILVGILIVVNFFSYRIFYRLDITQNKDFSISKVSKRTSGDLDDIVTIKVYFSRNLPTQFISLRQTVSDILNEYEASSKGRIKVEFIDPGQDEGKAREIQMKGIPQLQFEVYEKDKLQLVNGFIGIEVAYGSRTDVIPVIEQDANNLEYQLTTSIKKVTKKEIGTIGYLTGFGTAGADSEIKEAYKKLGELYTIEQPDLSGENPAIPETVKTLVIAGPKEKFSDKQLKAIDSFVMRGGSLVVLYDGVTVGEGLVADKNESNLGSLLEKYGIKVNKDLVLDNRNAYASFTQGFFRFSSPYPYWPKVDKPDFDTANPTVADLESVAFPWVSSIDVDQSKLGEGGKVSRLAQTTAKAWVSTEGFNLNPQQGFSASGAQKSYALAVSVQGAVKSAYPGGNGPQENKDAKLVVVGDSDFMRDNLSQLSRDNLIFFQNLVDSVTIDQDLISIRSKSVSSRPLKETSDSQKAVARYLNVFGITAAVVAFGIIRYLMRRKRKFVDDL